MKISIVTVAYNSTATLKDTFESVLRQTYEDYEYILVDGGSTDGIETLVAAYAPRFGERLRFVSEADRGAYDGMNKGVGMATGDIVGILNSDDFFSSDTILASVAAAFEAQSVDAVYGDIHYVSPRDLHRCVRYYSSRRFSPSLMRLGFMPAHPSFYCKREVYQRYGGFDLSYTVAADFECLLRFICIHHITTAYIPLDFVTMRTGGISNATWRSHLQGMKDRRRALKSHGISSSYLALMPLYFKKFGSMMWSRITKQKEAQRTNG